MEHPTHGTPSPKRNTTATKEFASRSAVYSNINALYFSHEVVLGTDKSRSGHGTCERVGTSCTYSAGSLFLYSPAFYL
jgi:hypothetical protein